MHIITIEILPNWYLVCKLGFTEVVFYSVLSYRTMAKAVQKAYSDYKYLEEMVEDHMSFPMTKVEASALLPRFMNAVTIIVTSREKSQRLRLVCAVEQVLVFREREIPKELRPLFKGFEALISDENLSPKKAELATKILIKMFEEIVWSVSFDEP